MTNYKKITLMFGIWLCVYPLVTGILYSIRAVGETLPLPMQTLIATLILVPLMINWVVPFVTRRIE